MGQKGKPIMISWKKLCYSLNAMSKLPNGGGCEVEFDYRGKEYIIVTGKASYPGSENTFKDVKTLYDTYIK